MVQSLFGAVFERELFSTSECQRLIAAPGEWSPALVTDADGGASASAGKQATWKLIELGEDSEWIFARLAEFLGRRATYGFAVREIESPIKIQRYEVGGFHAWHVDLAAPAGRERKLGVSVQLSAPDDYAGGELWIYDPPTHRAAPRERGCGIAFPSYVPHEVGAVTPAFSPSTVLKQMAAIQASMPVHCGGLALSTNFGSSLSTSFGA